MYNFPTSSTEVVWGDRDDEPEKKHHLTAAPHPLSEKKRSCVSSWRPRSSKTPELPKTEEKPPKKSVEELRQRRNELEKKYRARKRREEEERQRKEKLDEEFRKAEEELGKLVDKHGDTHTDLEFERMLIHERCVESLKKDKPVQSTEQYEDHMLEFFNQCERHEDFMYAHAEIQAMELKQYPQPWQRGGAKYN
uniref:BZIP domain-containing protein n=1 Tax=Caenorhabditis tropicalis TaxID=1561998 RepID=A0A1I7UF41_9PELO